jgi:hypothetical protein
VLELNLHNHVRMMGRYTPIEPEWAKGAIAAVSADREPFGMTLVEAMRCGVPVVSTDAPHGPGEILTHGEDGLLTPVGDPDAMGDALLHLINDDALRKRMAAAALASSERYDPDPIAARYEALFTDLSNKRKPWRRRKPLPVLGPVTSVTTPTLDWDGASPLPDGVTLHPVKTGIYHVRDATGTTVQAGLRDTRALLDGPVGARIQLPYRTPDGKLAVRVWDQPVYAEVGAVDADADGVHVRGHLHGAHYDNPVLEARHDGTVEQLPVTTEGPAFRVTIPALAPGTWALWLRHATTAEPVRLARVRDDIIDKRVAFVLPAASVQDVRLQPTYTESNEFEIHATA